jgi:hypothetical protein
MGKSMSDDLMSTEYKDWTITVPFSVPPGDVDGVMTEAIFEAAVHHLPSEGHGLVVRADTAEGKVFITFTLAEASKGFAQDVAKQLRERVHETVFSSDDACVTSS